MKLKFSQLATISGWLQRTDFELLREANSLQNRSGRQGNILEIGVHFGRLFLALAGMLRSEERAIGVDLFESQAENIDRSGGGATADDVWLRLQQFRLADRCKLIQGNSLADSIKKSVEENGPYRLVSVDGGHHYAAALSDINLAISVLTAHGIIAVDDTFDPAWPEVTLALTDALRSSGCAPFAISNKKTYVCKPDFSNHYKAAIIEWARQNPRVFIKETAILGHRVPCVRDGSFEETIKKAIKVSARNFKERMR